LTLPLVTGEAPESIECVVEVCLEAEEGVVFESVKAKFLGHAQIHIEITGTLEGVPPDSD